MSHALSDLCRHLHRALPRSVAAGMCRRARVRQDEGRGRRDPPLVAADGPGNVPDAAQNHAAGGPGPAGDVVGAASAPSDTLAGILMPDLTTPGHWKRSREAVPLRLLCPPGWVWWR